MEFEILRADVYGRLEDCIDSIKYLWRKGVLCSFKCINYNCPEIVVQVRRKIDGEVRYDMYLFYEKFGELELNVLDGFCKGNSLIS